MEKAKWLNIGLAALLGAVSGVVGAPVVTAVRAPTLAECRDAGHVAAAADAPFVLSWSSLTRLRASPVAQSIVLPAFLWLVHAV